MSSNDQSPLERPLPVGPVAGGIAFGSIGLYLMLAALSIADYQWWGWVILAAAVASFVLAGLIGLLGRR